MKQDEFTKLFGYMEHRFNEFDKKLDAKASQTSIDSLTSTVASISARLDTLEIELAASNS